MRETVLNILKGSGTEKRGEETKILERGNPGQRVGALKTGWGWNLLTNYVRRISGDLKSI